MDNHQSDHHIFFGSWLDSSRMRGGGIRWYEQDEKTGRLSLVDYVAEELAVGAIRLSADGRFLYAIDEIRHRPDYSIVGGSVHKFEVDYRNHKISHLQRISTAGGNPCYLTLHNTDRYLIASNYGSEGDEFTISTWQDDSGNINMQQSFDESSLALIETESPNGLSLRAIEKLSGKPTRVSKWLQSTPHPHSVNFSPAGNLVLVTDRGCDSLLVYNFDENSCSLKLSNELQLDRGYGPRNAVFHPTLPFFYVLSEIMPRLSAFSYDQISGNITLIENLRTSIKEEISDPSLLPQDLSGFLKFTHPADVQIHPNGKFLYITNRAEKIEDNNVAVFLINPKDGTLNLVQHQNSKGHHCRICVIGPLGRYMYVGNQSSGNVETFRIDLASGSLMDLETSLEIPRAVCAAVIRLPAQPIEY